MARRSVNPHLEVDYEEFRNRIDPFGMSDELAAARTLLVEFREAIEAQSEAKVQLFCKGVGGAVADSARNIVGHALGVPEEDRHEHEGLAKLSLALAKSVRHDILAMYEEVFGEVSRITPEQARVMAGLLKNVGDLAEKFKKISEGVSLKVNYDGQVLEMMARFLAMVILPYCSMEQKAIMGVQAEKFLPSAASLFQEDILDG